MSNLHRSFLALTSDNIKFSVLRIVFCVGALRLTDKRNLFLFFDAWVCLSTGHLPISSLFGHVTFKVQSKDYPELKYRDPEN